MFGTLHWNSHTGTTDFVVRPHPSADVGRSPACDRCRAKKVKCQTDSTTCIQCERAGSTCTFSYTKYRSKKRKDTEGSDTTEQKRSTAPSTQSPIPSSLENIGRKEEINLWPVTVHPSTRDDFDQIHHENGRQMVMDSSSNEQANILMDFDQSFFSGFDSREVHQYMGWDWNETTPFSTYEPDFTHSAFVTQKHSSTFSKWPNDPSDKHEFWSELGMDIPDSWLNSSLVNKNMIGFGRSENIGTKIPRR